VAHRRLRWRRADPAVDAAWAELLAPHVSRFTWLTDDQRVRLGPLAAALVAGVRWEAARGFEVTDEMRLSIAAQAALLIVEGDPRSYHDVSSIIVHPSTIVLQQERSAGVPGCTDSMKRRSTG